MNTFSLSLTKRKHKMCHFYLFSKSVVTGPTLLCKSLSCLPASAYLEAQRGQLIPKRVGQSIQHCFTFSPREVHQCAIAFSLLNFLNEMTVWPQWKVSLTHVNMRRICRGSRQVASDVDSYAARLNGHSRKLLWLKDVWKDYCKNYVYLGSCHSLVQLAHSNIYGKYTRLK